MSDLDQNTCFQRNPELISVDMDGDVVMMSVSKGNYYGINPVGARIWELLAQPHTLAQLSAIITAEYEVEDSVCAADIRTFVERMLTEGVVSTV